MTACDPQETFSSVQNRLISINYITDIGPGYSRFEAFKQQRDRKRLWHSDHCIALGIA